MRFTLLASSLLVVAAALTFGLFVLPRDQDALRYEHIRCESTRRKKQKTLQDRPAIQERKRVQKDLWLPQEGERVHYRLYSDVSSLTLSQHAGRIEAHEEMRDLTLDVYESSVIRHLTALRGVYSYPSREFDAEKSSIALFQVGQPAPFLTGHAESIHLDPAKSTLTAYSVEAEYMP